jgi:uncharacterized membrane protein
MAAIDAPPENSDSKDDVSANAEQDSTVAGQLSAFVGDVVHMAQAEIAYYRTRFSYSQSVAKRIGLYAIVAVATFFAASTALIIGLLLILSSYLGPIIATIIVTISFLAIAVCSGLLARKSAQKLSFRKDLHDE